MSSSRPLRACVGLALGVSFAACAGVTPADLPERPARPHSFFELPRRAVELPIDDDGSRVTLSYVDVGAGPPLVLVHGLMTSSYSFRYIIPALAEHYRVIVPDLPGAGRSSAPGSLSESPPALAELLVAFLAALGLEDVYLVGNSMGGYLCLWTAARFPEKIRRLVVMHAPGFPEARLYVLGLALALPGSSALFAWLARDAEQFVIDNVHYHDPRIMSREETREYGAVFKDAERFAVFQRILDETMDPGTMGELHELLAARPLPQRGLPPTLLLWAREDVLVSPDYGPRYQELIPAARLQWLDDTSHFLQVEAPEATTAAILRFDGR